MNELQDIKSAEELRALILERNNRMYELVRKSVTDSNNPDVRTKPTCTTPKLFAGSAMNDMDINLHQMARKRVCERKESEFFENSELEELWRVLLENSNLGPPNLSQDWWALNVEIPMRQNRHLQDEFHMDYYYFMKSKAELGPRFQNLLTTKLFFTLKKASEPVAMKMDRIRTLPVFRYICEKNYRKLVQMALYKNDVLGTGYITEDGLANFLLEYEPFQLQFFLAPQFRNEYYVTVAVKRFFFFLDPQRKGRIRIVDILASGLIDEIRFPDEEKQRTMVLGDEEVEWFSLKTANRIYHHFENLDQNFKALLSESDFLKFGLDLCKNVTILDDDRRMPATQLTPTFVHKLFESVATIGGRMDFRTFTEFVLANTYIKEPQSIAYFIRIFDRDGRGYLNESDLNYFYKDIQKRCGRESVDFADIRNDIFDTIKPTVPGHITAADIIKCGKGPDIIRMLISVKGFENFETFDESRLDLPPVTKPLPETEVTKSKTKKALRYPEEGNETEKMHFKKMKGSKNKRAKAKLTRKGNDTGTIEDASHELM